MKFSPGGRLPFAWVFQNPRWPPWTYKSIILHNVRSKYSIMALSVLIIMFLTSRNLTITFIYYLVVIFMEKQAVAARWAATAWFSRLICMWQLHAASPLRSTTYISKHAGANQIATRLLRHCSGPARCCSQPASRSLWPTWGHRAAFLEICHYFRNDNPKPSRPALSCTWSSRVCVINFAVVRPRRR